VSYLARWREGGKVRSKTFRDPDERVALELAEEHVRRMDRALRSGRPIPPADLTVLDVVNQYLTRGASRWKDSTYATYCRRTRACIERQLGRVRVRDLEPARVQHWIDRLVAEGWSAESVHGAKRVLNGAMKEAVRLGILAASPATDVTLPRIAPPRHTTWTVDQMQRVLAAVRDEPMWHALYRLVLTSGMRPGEALALRWADVDLDRVEDVDGAGPHAPRSTVPDPVVIVRRTMSQDRNGRRIVGTSTKTGDDRVVSIPPACAAALRAWRHDQKVRCLAAATWEDGDYVFTGRRGQPLDATTWRRYTMQLCDRLGIPRITLHELRHTNATVELLAGTHPKIVANRIGHKHTQTTLDTYSHVSPALHRAATAALERRLEATVPDATTFAGEEAEMGQNQGKTRSKTRTGS
jgi:integrase